MGKKRRNFGHHDKPAKKPNHQQRAPPPPKQPLNKNQKKQQAFQQQQLEQNPIIPFDRDERILLVGEGDLSFAASLIKHHRCTNVTATVLDANHNELVDRYPDVDRNIAIINNEPEPEPVKADNDSDDDDDDEDNEDGEDKTDTKAKEDANAKPQAEEYTVPEDEDEYDMQGNLVRAARPFLPPNNRLLYNINVLKPLPSSLKSTKAKTYHRIFFNFPHVGGKTTDQSRQVRHNQDLLVNFFNRLATLLSVSPTAHNDNPYSSEPPAPTPTMIVTLFEGEPYTQWNIRQLASSAGLVLDHSFKFFAKAYPGYAHARTLGVVKNRKGDVGGGWKGENRPARTYLFRRKDDPALPQMSQTKKRKREAQESDDDSD